MTERGFIRLEKDSAFISMFTLVTNGQVQKLHAQSRYVIVVPGVWGVFNEVKEHVANCFSLKRNECNVRDVR